MAVGHTEASELMGSLSALLRTGRALAQRHSAEMGASGTPIGVLKTLVTGDLRPSDLATALHVAPSVISRALVPLEHDGLVERTTDPADGRATLIALTALGRQRLQELQNAYVARVSSVLDNWSDAEARQAATLMNRLETALTEALAPAAHPLIATTLIPTDIAIDIPTDIPTETAPDDDVDASRSTRKPVLA